MCWGDVSSLSGLIILQASVHSNLAWLSWIQPVAQYGWHSTAAGKQCHQQWQSLQVQKGGICGRNKDKETEINAKGTRKCTAVALVRITMYLLKNKSLKKVSDVTGKYLHEWKIWKNGIWEREKVTVWACQGTYRYSRYFSITELERCRDQGRVRGEVCPSFPWKRPPTHCALQKWVTHCPRFKPAPWHGQSHPHHSKHQQQFTMGVLSINLSQRIPFLWHISMNHTTLINPQKPMNPGIINQEK